MWTRILAGMRCPKFQYNLFLLHQRWLCYSSTEICFNCFHLVVLSIRVAFCKWTDDPQSAPMMIDLSTSTTTNFYLNDLWNRLRVVDLQRSVSAITETESPENCGSNDGNWCTCSIFLRDFCWNDQLCFARIDIPSTLSHYYYCSNEINFQASECWSWWMW